MKFDDFIHKITAFFSKYDEVIFSSIVHICFAILIFMLGKLIAKFVSKQLTRILNNRSVDPTIIKFVSSLVGYVIMVITLVAVLGQIGVQTASIVAVIGAAGLAIGLALQGSLSNFAAGVILILFRPFKVGETVVINSQRGVIDSIQIFSTTLITATGEVVVIPNGQVVSANIVNFTRIPERRVDVVIGVGYDSDIQKVYQFLQQAVNQTDNILETKKTTILLTDLDSSSINYSVQVWTTNGDYNNVKAKLLENIKNILTNNNINIPYPTMDINLNKTQNS